MKFAENRITIFKHTVDMDIAKKYSHTPRVLSPFKTKGSIEMSAEAKKDGTTIKDILFPKKNRSDRRSDRKPLGRKGRLDGVAIAHHATPWHRDFADREQLKKLVADNDALLAMGAHSE